MIEPACLVSNITNHNMRQPNQVNTSRRACALRALNKRYAKKFPDDLSETARNMAAIDIAVELIENAAVRLSDLGFDEPHIPISIIAESLDVTRATN